MRLSPYLVCAIGAALISCRGNDDPATGGAGGGGGGGGGNTGPTLPSRPPIVELQSDVLPQGRVRTQSVATADVDGDQDIDVAFGTIGLDQLFLSDGTNFTKAPDERLPQISESTRAVVFGDLTGDGAPELVAGYGSESAARVFRNNGQGTFTEQAPRASSYVTAIAIADIDGDRDNDLVFARGAGAGRANGLWINDGSGGISEVSSRLPAQVEQTSSLLAFDVDKDGDVDLLFGNEKIGSSRDRLVLNDGQGNFSDASRLLPNRNASTRAIAAGDVNGDGRIDLVFAGPGQNQLFFANNRASYDDATAGALPTELDDSKHIELFDADGDGDLDLLVVNDGSASRLHLNDGTGRFTPSPNSGLRNALDRATSASVRDLDGDGDADLIFGLDGANSTVYWNDGKGSFIEATRSGTVGPGDPAVVAGDVNGDGAVDLLLPNRSQLLANDGRGGFVPAPLPATGQTVRKAALFDADGDGKVDLVYGGDGQAKLFVGDGAGGFVDETASRLPENPADRTAGLLVLDADGDGDLDLFLANDGQQNRLWVNDGAGKFSDETSSRLPTDTEATTVAVAGDLDGDGDVDFITAGSDQSDGVPTVVHRNDGTGVFTREDALLTQQTTGLALGDVDGDSDLDLLVANKSGSASNSSANVLFRNVEGRLGRTDFPTTSSDSGSVQFANLDNAGGIDAIVAGNPSEVFLNDGDGGFVDATRAYFPDPVVADTFLVADVDRDQDADLIAVDATGTTVYRNLTYQLFSRNPPRVGKLYNVEIWARAGLAPAAQVALPYMRVGDAQPVIQVPPFGAWHLGGLPFVLFDAIAIPSPAGGASLPLALPQDPILIGVPLTWQALIANGTDFNTWRLTNVWTDRVSE